MIPKKIPINNRSDIAPDPKPLPLQTFETALEVYLIIQELPQARFKVSTIQEIINTRYRAALSTKRIRQILDGLADRGRIVKKTEQHDYHNIPVNVYQKTDIPTILVDSPIYNIISIIYEKQHNRSDNSDSRIQPEAEKPQEIPIRKLA